MQYGKDACDIAVEECRWEIYDVLSYAGVESDVKSRAVKRKREE